MNALHSTSSAIALPAQRLAALSAPSKGLVVLAATALLTAGSWLQVPMFPVPMTMQTFAVTMVGAVLGRRLGTLAVMLWLAEAMLGLPVLAGGKSGLAPFMGPTAGFLLSFPLVAWMVGDAVERGWASRALPAVVVMCLGNALCLAIGGTWLAMMVGAQKAWLVGVAPFILGGVLKSALAVASLGVLGRAASALRR